MRLRPSSFRPLATSCGLSAALWAGPAIAAPEADAPSVEEASAAEDTTGPGQESADAAAPDDTAVDSPPSADAGAEGPPDDPADGALGGAPEPTAAADDGAAPEPATSENPDPQPPPGDETEDPDPDPVPADTEPSPAEADASDPGDEANPPRISGPYLGIGLFGAVSAVRVNEFGTDGALAGGGGYLRFGQMVLPWLGIGLQGGGTTGSASNDGASQSLGQGALLVDFNFVPAPRRVAGLSVRASFGFGGGAVREDGVDGRAGFGGAFFGAGARYEFFPGVKRYRPTKGGGFGIGPEIGWLGATPSARGRPMAHTFFTGISLTFYFGD